MNKLNRRILSVLALISLSDIAIAQVQKGNDIDGEATGDRSGWSVSMPDNSTIAIGSPQNDGNGGNSGQVRIYNWSGSSWVQKGSDLNGDAANDLFGSVVSMPDANTVAIGAPQNDGADVDAGQVKIFEWNGSAWNLKGSIIEGDSSAGFFGYLFGSSISMPNANTIAISSPWHDINGSFAGQVKIFDWVGGTWTQRGLPIDGSIFSYFGSAISMPSSNVVAIASQGGTPGNTGQVKIYNWNGSAWVQKGNNIMGEASGDYSGSAISMPDENTIAIGASDNDGSFPQAGHVRIYEWNNTSWVQKGGDIDGEAQNDESGNAVSMPDANTIAIGAILNNGQAGHTRIYKWNGTNWTQLGIDIDGEAAMDKSGYSVSMPDANTVAIGAIQNDAVNGSQFFNEAGHVRIYELSHNTGIGDNYINTSVKLYPNPTRGKFTIELNKNEGNISLTLRNVLGQELWKKEDVSSNTLSVEITTEPGIYLLEVAERNKKSVIKIIKE